MAEKNNLMLLASVKLPDEKYFGGKQSKGRKFNNKIYNQIRVFTENEVAYLKVKLQGDHTMFCDIKDYELLRSRIWYAYKFKHGNNYYCVSSKNELFHRLIYSEYKNVDHINQNTLDNRRKNLRDGNGSSQRSFELQKNNTSGVNGLSYDKNKKRWKFIWFEEGKRKQKYFYGTQEEVKER